MSFSSLLSLLSLLASFFTFFGLFVEFFFAFFFPVVVVAVTAAAVDGTVDVDGRFRFAVALNGARCGCFGGGSGTLAADRPVYWRVFEIHEASGRRSGYGCI